MAGGTPANPATLDTEGLLLWDLRPPKPPDHAA
jgi:hypothetical protein